MAPSSLLLLDRARQQLARRVLRLLAPAMDVTPAEGGLGASPFHIQPEAAPALGGAALPSPSDDATLLAAALLAPHDVPAAQARLEGWLHADTPGLGPRWSSAADIACRLIHMAAIHTTVPLPTPLAQQLAGSARGHAAALCAQVPTAAGDPDIALCHAALVIAGQAWPALEGARGWRGAGLGGLRQSLSDAAGDDGPGAADPTHLARAAWAVALARTWLEAAGASLPRATTAAWLQCVDALWRIGGDTGFLPPPPATVQALLPLGPAPLPHTLRNLAVCWGLADAGLACDLQDDPAVALLGAAPPPGLGGQAAPMADEDWRMWAWRASGVVACHRSIRRAPAQLWCAAPQERLALSLGGKPLLLHALRPCRLDTARVDGPQATLLLRHTDGTTTDVRLRQARLSITAEGCDTVQWTLPDGWTHHTTDEGFELRAPQAPLLAIKTDPAWQWAIHDSTLRGTGAAQRIRYSFELR